MTVSTDGYFKEYSLQKSSTLFENNEDAHNELFTVDFNKSGSKFATAGKDGFIRVYDDEKRELLATMKSSQLINGHSNRVQCVKFHPTDENLVVSGGWDKCLIVYDLRIFEPIISVVGPHICGESIAISESDGTIVTGAYV